ncbi:acyl-CoA thioesterase [Alicyclobacillus cycloheptanicus]|uniref:Acyl-CoA thioester hydrolase n=1 Tax=Alicyclobacillus cycloheptanicus TaxID=1457 RepID=A0ABT9XFA5_9BACL|nr:thioesterase family protein [Alicyclobacillus cycloheptanicus]MDQ0188976.1 acyl-CoA thioester hydrolase [Alicyclobacillus cycloheptanicus]WDM01679.1 acyl-CoA thioesterase [Alicyclobacillus cycloheptanicus]
MKHEMKIKVRFRDTDMLGHVNNSTYFTYMEEARIAFVEDVLGNETGQLILAAAQVNYRSQTFFGQTLLVRSWVSRIGNSSFDVACEMADDKTGTVVFDGVATVVYFDYETQKSVPIPDFVRDRMQPYVEFAAAKV